MTTQPDQVDAQVCYLLVTPYTESVKALSAPLPVQRLRDAPYFVPTDIDISPLDSTNMTVDGVPVSVRRSVYDELSLVAECVFALPDALSDEAQLRKDRIQEDLKARLLKMQPDPGELFEEYAILLIATVDGAPDAFIDRNGQALARFLRSQRDEFGADEIQSTLMSRVRYSEHEMTVVDWEGAVIIAQESDFQSDIELLKIGNYQLLRYRLLDQIDRTQSGDDRPAHARRRAHLLVSARPQIGAAAGGGAAVGADAGFREDQSEPAAHRRLVYRQVVSHRLR